MGQGNEQEQKSSGDWKGKVIAVVMTLLVIGAAFLYMGKQSADSPVIAVDGVEFKLQQYASVLTDAGFEITGGSSLDGRTWDELYKLEKDGKVYAYLTLYNTSTSSKELPECKIGGIEINDSEVFDAADQVTINGIKVIGMSLSEAGEAFGIEDNGSTAMSKTVGECSVMFSHYDRDADKFEKVSVSYDFGKAY